MEIILSEQCESLTGSLDRRMGYYIRISRGGRYYSQRSKHGNVPPDGHWRFILACAKLAQNGLHVTDIQISWTELYDALYEALYFISARHVKRLAENGVKRTYNATDIINLKHTFSL